MTRHDPSRIDTLITIYAAVSLAVCAALLALGAALGRL